MDRLVNVRLMSNPWNWIIVIAFVVMGAALLRELTRLFEIGNGFAPQIPGK